MLVRSLQLLRTLYNEATFRLKFVIKQDNYNYGRIIFDHVTMLY